MVALALTLLAAHVVFAQNRTPRVVLLGSGDHLSALIVDGDARMLIASGTDGTAFLNAFASALPINDRRIDVLVIAGGKADLPVAAAARASIDARRTFVLDGGLSASLDDLHLNSSALLTGGKRLSLGPALSVSLETASRQDGAKLITGWQATVVHGRTRVRIVSDARFLNEFRSRQRASGLVIASKPDASALTASFLSLVVPAALSDPAPLLGAKQGGRPVVKVELGRTATLSFTIVGLELPKSAQSIATPPPQTGEPPRASTAETNSAWIASRRLGFTSTS